MPCETPGGLHAYRVTMLDLRARAVEEAQPMWLVAHPDIARIPRVRTVIDFLVAMMEEEPLMAG